MVSDTRKLEVRAVGAESFDDIYPLLLSFGNRKMQREDWRHMLFTYPWWTGSERGYALYAEGTAVGFIGTIFSPRSIAGRAEVFCNASSWIVREEYRGASIMLLRPLLALRDCTILNLTPTERSYDIFKKLGFKELESARLLLLPIANPASLAGGSYSSDREAFLDDLTQDERAIQRELVASPGLVQVVLRRGDRRCYLVAVLRRVKRVPVADVLYVGDREFFWRHRALAHLALWQTLGAAAIDIDARFARNGRARFAIRRSAKRLYRPAHGGLAPDAIDHVFSELMVLKI